MAIGDPKFPAVENFQGQGLQQMSNVFQTTFKNGAEVKTFDEFDPMDNIQMVFDVDVDEFLVNQMICMSL